MLSFLCLTCMKVIIVGHSSTLFLDCTCSDTAFTYMQSEMTFPCSPTLYFMNFSANEPACLQLKTKLQLGKYLKWYDTVMFAVDRLMINLAGGLTVRTTLRVVANRSQIISLSPNSPPFSLPTHIPRTPHAHHTHTTPHHTHTHTRFFILTNFVWGDSEQGWPGMLPSVGADPGGRTLTRPLLVNLILSQWANLAVAEKKTHSLSYKN